MKLLLLEEILHQLIRSLSNYLLGFLHPNGGLFGISSINSMKLYLWILQRMMKLADANRKCPCLSLTIKCSNLPPSYSFFLKWIPSPVLESISTNHCFFFFPGQGPMLSAIVQQWVHVRKDVAGRLQCHSDEKPAGLDLAFWVWTWKGSFQMAWLFLPFFLLRGGHGSLILSEAHRKNTYWIMPARYATVIYRDRELGAPLIWGFQF